ncbi:MAG: regulator of sigma factor [Acidimicrobiales bacterium]|jgi:transcriptional regulator with XRE-family HTH domain|nr:regulator of sigma factor [Acidimicrobiales bacterium]
MADIGTLLRAARARLGWSREELAFHAGVSWSAIAQIESGRRSDVRLKSLVALAGALGVSVDYLVRGGAPIPPLLEHRLLPYDSDEEFLAATVPFVAEGVERAEAVLVVTTRARIRRLQKACGGDAQRIEFAESSRWYRSPRDALGRYRAFFADHVAQGASWVRVVGEPVWRGRSEHEVQTWTRYESMLNAAFVSSPVTIVCPYDTRAASADLLAAARATHPRIERGNESTASATYLEPEEFLID